MSESNSPGPPSDDAANHSPDRPSPQPPQNHNKGLPVRTIWTVESVSRPPGYPRIDVTAKRKHQLLSDSMVVVFFIVGIAYWAGAVACGVALVENGIVQKPTVAAAIAYVITVVGIAHGVAYVTRPIGFLPGFYFAASMTLLCPFSYLFVICGGIVKG